MEIYSIKETKSTPFIHFDPTLGTLEIKGRSIPENSVFFYMPLFNALDEYVKNPVKNLQVKIQLEYYNSSSSVCILNLLKKLEILKDKVQDISIEWYYEEEDEDTLAAGHNFQNIIALPFLLIKLEN